VARYTIQQARRIALAAQGFAEPRPTGRIDMRHLRKVVDRVGVVQIDSVNIVARAHFLPFFARLGSYPMELADRIGWGSGEMAEYWAHEAALFPVSDWPLFRHRMESAWNHWPSMGRWSASNQDLLKAVLSEVRERGPLRPSDLEQHANNRRGAWWNWSDAKAALEALFFTGRVTVADRVNFQRYYDLSERVLSPNLVEARVGTEEAHRLLMRKALRSHGIGTMADLADYYRMRKEPSIKALAELVAVGEAEEVEVDGWKGPVYKDPAARVPRSIRGTAFLCPFDPLVWHRDRTERLFDFHYRIEIYTPPPKRVYGYYVFPVMHDGELVGRLDLKGDRQQGKLLVRGSYMEEGQDAGRISPPIAAELGTMAAWLGLADVVVEKKGNLAAGLRKAVG
jgi:uncharacterized protein YcaQ